MKKVLMFSGLVIAFVGYVLIKNFIQFQAQEEQKDVFKPYLKNYISGKYAQEFTNEPYIRSKVLSIDVNDTTVDEFTFTKFPEELRANKPEEIGTLLLCEWYEVKEGEYYNEETRQKTGDAYRSYANISIIDFKEKKLIYIKNFKGADPLGAFHSDGNFTSMQPMFELVDYINKLPRK